MNINKIKGKKRFPPIRFYIVEDMLWDTSGCENQFDLFKFIPANRFDIDPDGNLYYYFTKVDDNDMVYGWIVNSNRISDEDELRLNIKLPSFNSLS